MQFHNVATHGFSLQSGPFAADQLSQLIKQLGPVSGAGRRGMLDHPLVRQLADSSAIQSLLHPHLPGTPRAVRAIYFDKSPDSNWLVAWHQDLTLCVTEERSIPEFGPWSRKDGLIHVQPPVEILEQMITLRLHLDAADESNGALKVLPTSHTLGKLTPEAIERLRQTTPEVLCRANAGDILLMRPLILHASGRSTSPRHRRILHLEFAGADLPHGLCWNASA